MTLRGSLELQNCQLLQEMFLPYHDEMLEKDGGKELIKQVKRAFFLLRMWR
jgi:hypothetical protein